MQSEIAGCSAQIRQRTGREDSRGKNHPTVKGVVPRQGDRTTTVFRNPSPRSGEGPAQRLVRTIAKSQHICLQLDVSCAGQLAHGFISTDAENGPAPQHHRRRVGNLIRPRSGQRPLQNSGVPFITVRPADRQRPAPFLRNRPSLGATHFEHPRQGYVIGTGVQGGHRPILQIGPRTGAYGNIFGVPHIPSQGAVTIETSLVGLTTDPLSKTTSPEDHLPAPEVGARRVVPPSPDSHRAVSVFIHHPPKHPRLMI